MNWAIELFTNHAFIAVFISWIVAGVIKFLLSLSKEDGYSFSEELFRTGGMPSAHSAVVVSLTVTIFLLEGPTLLFIACTVFSILVIRDSFGVRKSVGEQAKMINKIAKHDHMQDKVKVVLGHTLAQVIAGIGLGAIVAVLVHLLP